MRVIVVVTFSLLASGALAQNRAFEQGRPAGRDIAIWGVGEEACSDVLREPRSLAELQPWIDGYLTGTKRSGHRQYTGYIASQVIEFCKRNPTVLISDAIRRVR